jgi:hypothetical protein
MGPMSTGTGSSHELARRTLRRAIWLPGLVVAVGAAVATAHGLYETAVAARVPAGIAWLYPVITDGLALVAYTATARLTGSAARYAWAVVVLAAGLSGLAQAAYLADGATLDAATALRFGVGAWPAIAAAITAHLLYLLATQDHPTAPVVMPGNDRLVPGPSHAAHSGWDAFPAVPTSVPPGVPAVPTPTGDPPAAIPSERAGERPAADTPARDRARAAAARHAARHGAMPTVAELMRLADVSHSTRRPRPQSRARTRPAPAPRP